MTHAPLRLMAVLAFAVLAACGAKPAPEAAPSVPGYEAVQDGEFLVPAIPPEYLIDGNVKTEVAYTADDPPNSIVVDVYARKLYWVMEGGRAIRYGIAVGREGLSFRGTGVIGRKAEWPAWQPTANMIRTRPDLYAEYAAGRPGGLHNPLGARALYLYRGGRDTMFRIHGTIDPATIGRATSAGCIRLFNQDAMDLYERADSGTKVRVRTLEESVAIEGPMMDDAWGRVVPETPENIAQKEKDLVTRAEQEKRAAEEKAEAEEKARKEAEKAEKKRLSACKRKGLTPEECPLPEVAATEGEATTG